MQPDEHIQQQLFWYGYYERNYVLTWERFVNRNSIIVDIGANIGYYSLIAAKKATGGRIYAFEPYKGSMEQLKTNIDINTFTNVVPVEAALSKHTESRSLFVAARDNRGMTGLSRSDNFSGEIETVKAYGLDQWWEENAGGKIDGIKMDIEGAELQALQGMTKILEQHQPFVFAEISGDLLNRFGNTPSEVFSFMRGFGYSSFRIIQPNVLQPLGEAGEDELVVFLPAGHSLPERIGLLSAG